MSEKSQGEFIAPAKAVGELKRLLQDKGTVEIRYTENQASFTLKDEKNGSVLIVTKLIEGNYPNYRQVIPTEVKERVSLVREEFLHALRRAEIMTSDKSNSVKLAFSKNNLSITANTPEVGEARELFDRLLSLDNGLGLYSEDILPDTLEQTGNFPQTYSHVGLINAAFRLSRRWD